MAITIVPRMKGVITTVARTNETRTVVGFRKVRDLVTIVFGIVERVRIALTADERDVI